MRFRAGAPAEQGGAPRSSVRIPGRPDRAHARAPHGVRHPADPSPPLRRRFSPPAQCRCDALVHAGDMAARPLGRSVMPPVDRRGPPAAGDRGPLRARRYRHRPRHRRGARRSLWRDPGRDRAAALRRRPQGQGRGSSVSGPADRHHRDRRARPRRPAGGRGRRRYGRAIRRWRDQDPARSGRVRRARRRRPGFRGECRLRSRGPQPVRDRHAGVVCVLSNRL